jgi:hypothetical protein
LGRFEAWDVLELGRFVLGCSVVGRFVLGCFVGAPKKYFPFHWFKATVSGNIFCYTRAKKIGNIITFPTLMIQRQSLAKSTAECLDEKLPFAIKTYLLQSR